MTDRDNGTPEDGAEALAPDFPFPIVTLGGSAGSLRPIKTFFQRLPKHTGAAYVVIVHHSSDAPPLLAKVLDQDTKLPVLSAKDGLKIEPDHIYVAEPGRLLSIKGDAFVSEVPEVEPQPQSIDFFLQSLSEQAGNMAIALILSGLRSDGTSGAVAIKSHQGLVYVQSPGSAEFPSMPESVIKNGSVDFIVTPEEMMSSIVHKVDDLLSGNVHVEPKPLYVSSDPLRDIFELLLKHTGCDFSRYKSKTVQRRLRRRMAIHSLIDLPKYRTLVENDPKEMDELFNELLIEVSSFFRDSEAFDVLAQSLPKLLDSLSVDQPLRIWVPACSTGEEVYSIAMLIQECLQERGLGKSVMIFATDMSQRAIDYARRGEYPESIVEQVGEQRLARFFEHKGDHFRIDPGIREQVIFARQNLIGDPPFTKVDMISCRNLLIYLDSETQHKLIKLFHFSLSPSGLLFLGSSESLGSQEHLFETISSKQNIYRRKSDVAVELPLLGLTRGSNIFKSPHPIDTWDAGGGGQRMRTDRLVSEILLKRHAPPSVLVNREGQFLFLHGRTGDFLEPPEGHPRMTVFEMARPGLKQVLPHAFNQAEKEKGAVVYSDISVQTNGHHTNIDLTVTYFDEPEALRGLFLTSFISQDQIEPQEALPVPESLDLDDHAKNLQEELIKTKESLQLAMQQKDWALQDLQASNEELQSSNEELQSTNEELETSREELQSMNEELTTINSELERRVAQLHNANDDMQNLLHSIEVATLFLDNDLHIKRFTPQVRGLIHLRDTDVGRPLAEITTQLEYAHLVEEADQVLSTLIPFETEVTTHDRHHFLLRIQAYRTSNNVIDGVVITFVNIDRLKRLEEVQEARDFFHAILQTTHEPLLVLDNELRVVMANRSFCESFHESETDIEGQLLEDLSNNIWQNSELQDILVNMRTGSMTPGLAWQEIKTSDGEKNNYTISVRTLEQPKYLDGRILLAIQEA